MGSGALVPLNIWLLLFLIPCLTTGYTITYFDCTDITRLNTYQLGEVCRPTGRTSPNNTVQYQIIQRSNAREIRGFSCQVVKTTFTDYCGAYSHMKMAEVPQIEVSANLPPASCSTIVNTEKFTNDQGQVHEIQLNTDNIIHSQELGLIPVDDDSVSC